MATVWILEKVNELIDLWKDRPTSWWNVQNVADFLFNSYLTHILLFLVLLLRDRFSIIAIINPQAPTLTDVSAILVQSIYMLQAIVAWKGCMNLLHATLVYVTKLHKSCIVYVGLKFYKDSKKVMSYDTFSRAQVKSNRL